MLCHRGNKKRVQFEWCTAVWGSFCPLSLRSKTWVTRSVFQMNEIDMWSALLRTTEWKDIHEAVSNSWCCELVQALEWAIQIKSKLIVEEDRLVRETFGGAARWAMLKAYRASRPAEAKWEPQKLFEDDIVASNKHLTLYWTDYYGYNFNQALRLSSYGMKIQLFDGRSVAFD